MVAKCEEWTLSNTRTTCTVPVEWNWAFYTDSIVQIIEINVKKGNKMNIEQGLRLSTSTAVI